jgi:hypothetical protein
VEVEGKSAAGIDERQIGDIPPDGWGPWAGDGRLHNVPLLAPKRQHAAFLKRIAAYGR